MRQLGIVDPELGAILDREAARQELTLELIASESFVPPAIMEVQGSLLTNKYAEGYPGQRYHGGASSSTPWRAWPSGGRWPSSGRSTPMCSPIRG